MKSRLTYFVFIVFLASALAVAGCGKNKSSNNDDTADDADGADDGADTAESDGSGEDEAVELDLADCEDGPAESDAVTDDNLQAACDCFEATVEDCTQADDLCADAANMGECIDKINAEIATAADTSSTDDTTDEATETASDESADGENAGDGDGDTAEEGGNLDISQCTNGLAEGDDVNANAAAFCECFDPEGANGCSADTMGSFCPAGTTVGECIEIVNAMAPAE